MTLDAIPGMFGWEGPNEAYPGVMGLEQAHLDPLAPSGVGARGTQRAGRMRRSPTMERAIGRAAGRAAKSPKPSGRKVGGFFGNMAAGMRVVTGSGLNLAGWGKFGKAWRRAGVLNASDVLKGVSAKGPRDAAKGLFNLAEFQVSSDDTKANSALSRLKRMVKNPSKYRTTGREVRGIFDSIEKGLINQKGLSKQVVSAVRGHVTKNVLSAQFRQRGGMVAGGIAAFGVASAVGGGILPTIGAMGAYTGVRQLMRNAPMRGRGLGLLAAAGVNYMMGGRLKQMTQGQGPDFKQAGRDTRAAVRELRHMGNTMGAVTSGMGRGI